MFVCVCSACTNVVLIFFIRISALLFLLWIWCAFWFCVFTLNSVSTIFLSYFWMSVQIPLGYLVIVLLLLFFSISSQHFVFVYTFAYGWLYRSLVCWLAIAEKLNSNTKCQCYVIGINFKIQVHRWTKTWFLFVIGAHEIAYTRLSHIHNMNHEPFFAYQNSAATEGAHSVCHICVSSFVLILLKLCLADSV